MQLRHKQLYLSDAFSYNSDIYTCILIFNSFTHITSLTIVAIHNRFSLENIFLQNTYIFHVICKWLNRILNKSTFVALQMKPALNKLCLFVCLFGFNVAFNIICHITTVSGCDKELNAHFHSAASLWYQIPDTFT